MYDWVIRIYCHTERFRHIECTISTLLEFCEHKEKSSKSHKNEINVGLWFTEKNLCECGVSVGQERH